MSPHHPPAAAQEPGPSGERASRPAPATTGLAAAGAETFSVSATVGGWRGVMEGAVPTAVFVVVLALAPSRLPVALGASLAVSGLALVARVLQRQTLTQVLSGAVLALVSAAWAWRTGQARDFYATGLLINAVWLAACLVSLAARWPLVGLAVGAWQAAEAGTDGWGTWRRDPSLRQARRRYTLATWLLGAMFALRLAVEVPLYLAGGQAASALGIARLALGLPLFATTVWFIWLLVRSARA